MKPPAVAARSGARRRGPLAPHRVRSTRPLLWAVAVLCFTLLGACGTDPDGSGPGSEPVADRAAGPAPQDGATDESAPRPTSGPVRYEPVVIASHPHDSSAYTQGLEFVDDRLMESTGLTGQSSIRLVEPETGRVIESASIDEPLFGEGATVVGDEIWQLTWQDETLLVWSLDGLTELRRTAYRGEGWGLCATEDRLVMSDGSDRLTFRDPETFDELGSVTVTDGGRPIDNLNELECVADRVWANIWQTDQLVSIDPATGIVDGIVDLAALVPDDVVDADGDNVANGIAYHHGTGRFWLTGKRWPVMYEVEFRPVP